MTRIYVDGVRTTCTLKCSYGVIDCWHPLCQRQYLDTGVLPRSRGRAAFACTCSEERRWQNLLTYDRHKCVRLVGSPWTKESEQALIDWRERNCVSGVVGVNEWNPQEELA